MMLGIESDGEKEANRCTTALRTSGRLAKEIDVTG
jgi:hypothetical protein